MNVKFFNPGLIYRRNCDEFERAITRTLNAGDLILREDVEIFEENLAKFVGTKYAVALNSGTDALYLALKALRANENTSVAVPSHTFVATAQVAHQVGSKLNMYDLGESPPESDIYMVAHISGSVEPLPKTDKPIIEDSCQALGAIKNPKTAAQAWSFYPAKILGAFGDAGALTTNDEQIADYVREARNHFKTDYSDWGINSRMDNLQAAILNVRMWDLPYILERRKEIAEKYLRSLEGVGLPPNQEGRVWQDFIVTHPKRDQLYDYLKQGGIETMKNEYPMPIPKLPKSAAYEAKSLRIPCNDMLTDGEVLYVIETINNFEG